MAAQASKTECHFIFIFICIVIIIVIVIIIGAPQQNRTVIIGVEVRNFTFKLAAQLGLILGFYIDNWTRLLGYVGAFRRVTIVGFVVQGSTKLFS